MTAFDLRRLDLNLVIALNALLEERNVSAAARRLGVSQPAASQSLAKLPASLRRRLLIRVGHQYDLTALAAGLQPRVHDLVHELGQVLAGGGAFDPSTTEREFVVSMSDYVAAVFGGPLVAHLAAAAPGARLRLDTAPISGFDSFREALRHLDGIVVPTAVTPPGETIELFTDSWCCVVSDHLAAEAAAWTESDFTSRGWVATHVNTAVPAQEYLRRAGVEIVVAVTAPTFSAVPYLVAGTPRVGLLHRRLADQLAGPAGVTIVPTPWAPPAVPMVMFYDKTRAQDPAVRWFLDAVETVARSLESRVPRSDEP
ncbi:LysR family transcriptional regulator [Aeromicrobium sp. UC242_57]|uniref:LysR family transcriptional regulator n=1 Tax=Aeromicrobium sp. UC242_57 TaxID=3374624 RepID=UPI0037B270C3